MLGLTPTKEQALVSLCMPVCVSESKLPRSCLCHSSLSIYHCNEVSSVSTRVSACH